MNLLLQRAILITTVLFLSIASPGQVNKVDVVGITVGDMETSVKFYIDVLNFKKITDTEYIGAAYERLFGLFGLRTRVVQMKLGEEVIELTDYITTGGRSIPEDARSNDLFFQHIAIVVSDMDKAYANLRKYKVPHISTAPQTLPASNTAAAGIKAFYFQDPDRHNLELIYFPRGKGQAKWHTNNGNIFLGIDHTAIGISDTKESLHFYSELLGIERKGESFNYGTEQEHLNNVEGASLHITGLRANNGPGIEFLQYLKPGPGKKYPRDTRADDLWYWQTTLVVNDAENLYQKLQKMNASFISKELIELIDKQGQLTKAFVVHDPDGHAILIEQLVNSNKSDLSKNRRN